MKRQPVSWSFSSSNATRVAPQGVRGVGLREPSHLKNGGFHASPVYPNAQPTIRVEKMASTTAAASTSASASGSSNKPPQPTLVAQGDWTKNLVHLAKTAELK